MEIAIIYYRYLRVTFIIAIPQMEADPGFLQAERLVKYFSGYRLLLYVLVNFRKHLDYLESNGKEIRLEFENLITDLSKRRNSYACLLLW